MAHSPRSLQITDAYRDRLAALVGRFEAFTLRLWGNVHPADIDASHRAWLAAIVPAVEQGQRSGLHLTTAYLAAFIASETGRAPQAEPVAEAGLVGTAEDGDPIGAQLAKLAIAAKVAIRDGKTPDEALAEQGNRARRLVSSAVGHAPRQALADQIASHPEIVGWNRVTHGGCGACLASAAHGYAKHERMLVHPHCHCTQEPVIRDVPDLHPRPTGPEIFSGWSRERQDQALGPEAATLVRQGRVAWPDLIARSPMEAQADYITQAVLAGVEG
jgi:hypothetical protein